jgi:hypothetical protein
LSCYQKYKEQKLKANHLANLKDRPPFFNF